MAILVSLLLAPLTVFAVYQANQAEEAQTAARIEHLSTSGLLAAYSPSPYAGDRRRASLLVRQAWNLTRTQPLPEDSLESLPQRAMSNLLRANQVIGHLRATLQGHSASVWSVAFSPGGGRVVSGSGDNSDSRWNYMLLIWGVNEDSWKRRGCAIAGRNLSLTEWRRYLPGRDYEQTCPDYPVHPEVIVDALSKAVRRWGEDETVEPLRQAVVWIEGMPVLHDRIALLWEKMDVLAREHPIRPVLASHIQRWMAELPATNRAYWKQRISDSGPLQ